MNSTLSAGNPFESKDYLTKQNLATSGAMNSENDAATQALQQNVARTGTNSAALAGTIASNARLGQRDLTQYNAGRDTANENTWLQQQDKLLGDEATGASEEAGLYSTSLGGQNSTLGTAQQGEDAQAQANDGMIDAGISAAGSVGGAFCPAKGSLYLLPGGSEVPVETLKVGDLIAGIDDEPQIIERIISAIVPVVSTTTENGYSIRTSESHAFALPCGGFTEAARCIGKMILSEAGPSRVVRVEPDGVDEVFNIITNGSHTYCAAGLWSLGVGPEEHLAVKK